MSAEDYNAQVQRDKLSTFEHLLNNIGGLVAPSKEKRSSCRREDEVLSKCWPRAKQYKHTSLIARNFLHHFPKMR